MAFRLGHQITCNLNKNLIFRNSSASARRYRSLSRGNESGVEKEDNGSSENTETIQKRNSRARSQPRSSLSNVSLRREFGTESSSQPPEQSKNQQQSKAVNTKSSSKKCTTYALQPKYLKPMATTSIHLNNQFAPVAEIQDVRPYENRLDEVQRQASVKYEQAIKTFNIASTRTAPAPTSNGYRYELDAAKPKVDKGTHVYNIVAEIKSREQSIAAQAPQLQPRNIKPYGDIMSKPWCTPLMERIKHKPLSISRLEEAIHKSISNQHMPSNGPESMRERVTVNRNQSTSGKSMHEPDNVQVSQASGTSTSSQITNPPQLQEAPRCGMSISKPLEHSMRKAYSTIQSASMSGSSSDSEPSSLIEYPKQSEKNDKVLLLGCSSLQPVVEKESKATTSESTSLQLYRASDKLIENNFVPKKREMISPPKEEKSIQENKKPCIQHKFKLKNHEVFKNTTPKNNEIFKNAMSKKREVFKNATTKNQPSFGSALLERIMKISKENLFAVRNAMNTQVNANEVMENKAFINPSHEKQIREAEPIKVTVGPKLKLQSTAPCTSEEHTEDEKSLIPQSGEKFTVPWLSWGDRVKIKQNEEMQSAHPGKLNLIPKSLVVKEKSRSLNEIQLRRYSTGTSIVRENEEYISEKEVEMENILMRPVYKDFVVGIDLPENKHFLSKNTFSCLNLRSYSTGIPDECIGEAPPREKKPLPCEWPPVKFPKCHENPDCKKKCVSEYKVPVKLRRLPKVYIPDPCRICPEPCDDAVRADGCIKVQPKCLPKLIPKPCPPIPPPCMTDVPLRRLKPRPVIPMRPCPPPPCMDPRADDGMKVVRKKLPKLVPKMCGRCEEVVMTSPPLVRLTPRDVYPPPPCKPPMCPEPPITRADDGMVVCRKELPKLIAPCCPRICDDHLVDGPPLKRLKCSCVVTERICPCVPTHRDPCCQAPRADSICNYKVYKKTLPAMLLPECYNEVSTSEFARMKNRHYCTYIKGDMCCYADKKIQPVLEDDKISVPGEENQLKENLSSTVEGEYEHQVLADKSQKATVQLIRKPIGGGGKRTSDIPIQLLRGGYSGKFSDVDTRGYSTNSTLLKMANTDSCLKYPKVKMFKYCNDFDNDFPKECLKRSGMNVVDDVLNCEIKRNSLPKIPTGDYEKSAELPTHYKRLVPLTRPKKRFHYGDEHCPTFGEEFTRVRRADDSYPPFEMKLPSLQMSNCLPMKKIKFKDCKKLNRLNISADVLRKEIPSWLPDTTTCRRADIGKDLAARNILPLLVSTDCPAPSEKVKYKDCDTLKRLPLHPFMDREPYSFLPSLLSINESTKTSLFSIALNTPRRSMSTLSSNFIFSNNFTELENVGRNMSLTLACQICDKDCKEKVVQCKYPDAVKKCDDRRCQKFPLPDCKPGCDPPLCDRHPAYPECTKQKSPYPAFSECKDEDPYLGLSECPPNNQYLQPRNPVIGPFVIIKPPRQRKIDPRQEEDCVIKKLNLKRPDLGTTTCEDFGKPYVSLRARDLIPAAMKQATCVNAEADCKNGPCTTRGKNCPIVDSSRCVPGEFDCRLVGKRRTPLICSGECPPCEEGNEGDLICKGTIRDCSPKPEPPPPPKPCKPYISKPSPPTNFCCPKPFICNDPPPDHKKGPYRKMGTVANINGSLNGGCRGINCSGGGHISNVASRSVATCGGSSGRDGKEKGDDVYRKFKKRRSCKKPKKPCGKPPTKPQKSSCGSSGKCKKIKAPCPQPKSCAKPKPSCAAKPKPSCAAKPKPSCAAKPKPSCAAKPKPTCSTPKKTCSAKPPCAAKPKPSCSRPKKTCSAPPRKPCSSNLKSIKCAKPCQKKKLPCKVPTKPKCSPKPAPVVSPSCPKKGLWERIVQFFRARPCCPAPDQWKKDKLKRDAEIAAAAAGFDLCPKKFVCPKKEVKPCATKKPCPFPPPPKGGCGSQVKKPCGSPKKTCGPPKKPCGAPKKPCGAPKKSCGPPKKSCDSPKKSCGSPKKSCGSPKKQELGNKKAIKCGSCSFSKGPIGKWNYEVSSTPIETRSTPSPIQTPYESFTECYGKTCVFRKQKGFKSTSIHKIRQDGKNKKLYSTSAHGNMLKSVLALPANRRKVNVQQSRIHKRPCFVPKRNFSIVASNKGWRKVYSSHLTLKNMIGESNILNKRNKTVDVQENVEIRNKENEILSDGCKHRTTVGTPSGISSMQTIFESVKGFFCLTQNSTPAFATNTLLDNSNGWLNERGSFESAESRLPSLSQRISKDLTLSTSEYLGPFSRPNKSTIHCRNYATQSLRVYTTGSSSIFKKIRDNKKRGAPVRYHNDDQSDEKSCPKFSKCSLKKPPCCGPNPRGFDCSIKAPYPPCTAQQAPYPSFSECQKECCKRPRNECTEQDRIFERQKQTGQLDICNILKSPPKDFRHNPPKKDDPGCKGYSTLAEAHYVKFAENVLPSSAKYPSIIPTVQTSITTASRSSKANSVGTNDEKLQRIAYSVFSSDLQKLSDREFKNFFLSASILAPSKTTCSDVKAEVNNSYLADAVRRYCNTLTLPQLVDITKKSTGTNSSIRFSDNLLGRKHISDVRSYTTFSQARHYSGRKDCKQDDPCAISPEGCCEPKGRESCDIKTPYPPCAPTEAPYPCFSDCNKGFPRIPICECSEQEKVFTKMKNAGMFDLSPKTQANTDPNCGFKPLRKCERAPGAECNRKYSTCTDMLFSDPNEETETIEEFEQSGSNFDSKQECEKTAYISEIASRMSDISMIGKSIFSRCFQHPLILSSSSQANLYYAPYRNFSCTKNPKNNKYALKRDGYDGSQSSPQLTCAARTRETYDQGPSPPCTPVYSPYASFSERQKSFNKPNTECSVRDRIFARLRSSGAYDMKNLRKAKNSITSCTNPTIKYSDKPQRRMFSSFPKGGLLQTSILQELSEETLKDMEERQFAKKVLATVKHGMEAIALSTNDDEAQEAYFQLYEELEKLCEQELYKNPSAEDLTSDVQPICSRDIFSDKCLNKNTVPHMADEHVKQMMTIDAIKSFSTSTFTNPTMSTTLYEETEKYKTERLQKELDDLLNQYKTQKM